MSTHTQVPSIFSNIRSVVVAKCKRSADCSELRSSGTSLVVPAKSTLKQRPACDTMSCRGYGSHRSHAPLRLGDGSSLEHGGRCCCVKEDVSCEAAASERRSMPTAQYCRCGALRASSLDHLFIPEDLSIVPIHLKYSKDKFRGVRVDGRMYFLPNRYFRNNLS